MFFGSMTLLEGKSVNDAKERISEVRLVPARARFLSRLAPVLITRTPCHFDRLTCPRSSVTGAFFLAGLLGGTDALTEVPALCRGVFIPTQIVNFALVPTHLRFVTVGVVSLFWSTSSLPIPPSSAPLTICGLYTDAYLSSVNAKKQAQIATEHAHAPTPEDEKKISEVA